MDGLTAGGGTGAQLGELLGNLGLPLPVVFTGQLLRRRRTGFSRGSKARYTRKLKQGFRYTEERHNIRKLKQGSL